MSTGKDVFDYVIVGAGAAGCILANRLSAHENCTVCLLEAGPPDDSIFLKIPAGVYKAPSNPKYAWQFKTEPSPGTASRVIAIPQGKTLGGSTAINGMNYNRGCREDYDGWARLGNRGWSYAEVLPYFKRSECRIGACDPLYRGTDGLLPITDCDWRHPLCDAFIEAMVNFGLPRNHDYNASAQAGVGYYQRYIRNGWRVSAARAFLRPVAGRKNLEIRTNAQASSVLFQGKKAVGVRYTRGPGQPLQELFCRREVILCCGAANTPKLLQLSGIGPAALCAEIGVPLIHNLPGVGINLQDHYMIHLVVRVEGIRTINGRGLGLFREGARWALGRPSILAIGPSLVFAFVNSRDVFSDPDIQVDIALGNYSDVSARRIPVFKIGFYKMRPRSSGFVRARSANPGDQPLIQPHYLVAKEDQQTAVDGIKMLRRMLKVPELRRYLGDEEFPGASVESDADCLDFAQQAGSTSYHLSGTCCMGPRGSRASVVDDRLRVYGVDGLRIADASIMPTVPSANTSAAVFMIAEKASDMILGHEPLTAMLPTLEDAENPARIRARAAVVPLGGMPADATTSLGG